MPKIVHHDKRSLKLLIVTQVVVVLLLYLDTFYITDKTLKWFCTSLIIVLSLLAYYILFRIIRGIIERAQKDAKNEAILKQKQIQEEHYLALEQSREQIMSMKDIILESIINDENLNKKSNEEKSQSITMLISDYREMNAIDNCLNKVVDAILYNKALLAKAKRIKFHIMAMLPEEIAIDPVDIMCIFTNLLDNAIDANMKLDEGKRYIRIETTIDKNYLVVKVENPKSCTDKVLIEKHKTTKEDKKYHGLGLSFVKTTCKKLGGRLVVDEQEEIIKMTALLQIQDQK